MIKLLRASLIMKGDNIVIGVSSVDSSTINLRKRVWSESLLESDSACERFRFEVFSLGFWFSFISIGNFAEFTVLPMQNGALSREMSRGKPIRLPNQGNIFSILKLRKGTSNLGSQSQDYNSPSDKRGELGLSSA